jgi:hypothetical protein
MKNVRIVQENRRRTDKGYSSDDICACGWLGYVQGEIRYDGGIMISIEALLSSVGVALQLSVCVPQLHGSLDIGVC